jgi:hypothetical protein
MLRIGIRDCENCPALMLTPTRVTYQQVSQEPISFFRVLAPPLDVGMRSARCSISAGQFSQSLIGIASKQFDTRFHINMPVTNSFYEIRKY